MLVNLNINFVADPAIMKKSIFSKLFFLLAVFSFVVCYFLLYFNEGRPSTVINAVRFLIFPSCFSIFVAICMSDNRMCERIIFALSRIANWRGVVYAYLVYSVIFSVLKILKLQALHYEYFDAGIYINKLWRLSNVSWTSAVNIALFEGHFQPILLFYSLLYNWAESPIFPFVLQTLTIASGAVPIYFLAYKKIGSEFFSSLISIAYLLNPLVQFNDILGFHPDHVVLPSLLWAFYFAEIKSYHRSLLSVLVLCLAGEPWMPAIAAFGLYLMLKQKQIFFGLGLFMTSGLLFTFLIFYILPGRGAAESVVNVFSPEGYYASLLNGSPLEIFKLLGDPKKFFFVAFVFGPLLFFPIFSPLVFLVAVPDLCKTLLSSELLHYSVEGHYTGVLIAVGFVGYIESISKFKLVFNFVVLRTLVVFTVLLFFCVSIVHSPLPISFGFWSRVSGGAFSLQNYLVDQRSGSLNFVSELIGRHPGVRVEVSNGALTVPLAERNYFSLFPSAKWVDADYVVLDKIKFNGAGANSAQLNYFFSYGNARERLADEFSIFFEDSYVQVWKRSQSK